MPAKVKVLDSLEGYDLAARHYDEMEGYLNSFEKDNLFYLLKNVRDKKILDVGAGTGRVSVALKRNGAKVTALDLSEKMLAILKRKEPAIEIVIADAEELPFPDESFDVIVAAFLIVHLSNPQRFFDEAYRVLKDGGQLLITNINQKEPPEVKTEKGKIKIESYYHRPEEIKEKLEELAFAVEEEIIVKEKDAWINQIILAKK
jgi:ubiquinone/menaquinone biosynthesis C-methylase UbiE